MYEALTHPRPHRKRQTPDEAMKGSFVELNTKEVAQVVKVNRNFPLLPTVDIFEITKDFPLSLASKGKS